MSKKRKTVKTRQKLSKTSDNKDTINWWQTSPLAKCVWW